MSCVAFATCLTLPAAAQEDPWFAEDKALHFSVSAAIAGGGYALAVPVTEERWQRALFGGSLAIAAGAGKEAYDATGAGTPSYKDFTWDVIGAATGVGLALLIDWAFTSQPERPPLPAQRETALQRSPPAHLPASSAPHEAAWSPTADTARDAAERAARLWLVAE